MNPIAYFFKCSLVLLSCELVLGAHFYVDYAVRDGVNGPSLRLFKCHQTGSVGQPRRKSFEISRSVPCDEVTKETEKINTYATANFYMVNRLQMQDGRSAVFKDKRTKALIPGVPAHVNLGIRYSQVEFPPLVDLSQSGDFFTEQSIVQMRNALAGVFADVNQVDLWNFLKLSNFGVFADSRFDSDHLLTAFTRTLRNVIDSHKKSAHRSQSFQTQQLQACALPPPREQALNNLRTVIRILIHKMIDPCLIMSQKTAFALGSRNDRTEVDSWCGTYCAFISTSSGVFNIRPSVDCSNLIVGGKCAHNMCTCDQSLQACGGAFLPFQGTVAMAKCHNDLRKLIP